MHVRRTHRARRVEEGDDADARDSGARPLSGARSARSRPAITLLTRRGTSDRRRGAACSSSRTAARCASRSRSSIARRSMVDQAHDAHGRRVAAARVVGRARGERREGRGRTAERGRQRRRRSSTTRDAKRVDEWATALSRSAVAKLDVGRPRADSVRRSRACSGCARTICRSGRRARARTGILKIQRSSFPFGRMSSSCSIAAAPCHVWPPGPMSCSASAYARAGIHGKRAMTPGACDGTTSIW